MKIIALLTDFGYKDGYVASMKGVILKICPEATIVDVAHHIDPFRVESGAYVLKTIVDFFPEGTVFVAVVDPGVGTERRTIALKCKNKFFVGPDNGIFSWLIKKEEFFAISIENSHYMLEHVSSTFHGRDIFAPVGAYILKGVELEHIGQPISDPYIAPWVYFEESENQIKGKIIHIDHFGNCITNIEKNELLEWLGTKSLPDEAFQVFLGKNFQPVSFAKTYGSLPIGMPLALWGSSGHIEISVNQGNASKALGIFYGDSVVCKFDHTGFTGNQK